MLINNSLNDNNLRTVRPISIMFSESLERAQLNFVIEPPQFYTFPHLYNYRPRLFVENGLKNDLLICHLKELTLSYQKIIKQLKWDHPNPNHGRPNIQCHNNYYYYELAVQ